jgi:hypothetical protein
MWEREEREREEREEREERRSPQEPPCFTISKITGHFHAPIALGAWRVICVLEGPVSCAGTNNELKTWAGMS